MKSSERFRPKAFTRIRIHPGDGRGTGSSSIASTSGAPGSRMMAAFIVVGVIDLVSSFNVRPIDYCRGLVVEKA